MKESTSKPAAPVQRQEAAGPAKTPPSFGLSASPMQMFGGIPGLTKCMDYSQYSEAKLNTEKADLQQWLIDNPLDTKRNNAESAVKSIDFELDRRKKYDEVKASPHTMGGLHDDLGDMVRTMITAAGFDPDQWYKDHVSIQLFGQTARGIRKEFAEKLKEGEKKTCEKLSAIQPKLINPIHAGKYMGLTEGYATSRALKPEKPEYQSMHLFGMAIDFNYTNNPWISESDGDRANLKSFIKRTDALFNTNTIDTYSYTGADSQVADAAAMGTIFDGYDAVDKQVEAYFQLVDDEKKLEETLKASTSKEWNTLSVKAAKKKIEGDLSSMSKQWSRGSKKDNVKKHGIMDLHKELVTSMAEVGLDWGGKYGDMMHFDTRFSGEGKKIQAAKSNKDVRKLKADLIAEKEKKAAEKKAAAEKK